MIYMKTRQINLDTEVIFITKTSPQSNVTLIGKHNAEQPSLCDKERALSNGIIPIVIQYFVFWQSVINFVPIQLSNIILVCHIRLHL